MTHSTIKGINHVGLCVSDLQAAAAFYERAAGISQAPIKGLGNPMAEMASGFEILPEDRLTLRGPNAYLQLSQYAPLDGAASGVLPVAGPGVTHVCFQSATQKNIYARFKAQGAVPVSRGDAPISLLGQGVYYAYARDLDGIMFETEHLDRPHFNDPVWLSHVALVSPDIDQLVAFYQTVLGVQVSRRANKAAGPTFDQVADYDDVHIRAAWFHMENMDLELWQFVNPVTPETGPPAPFEQIGYQKFAFEVSDIQKDYGRLVDAGITFLSKPVESAQSTEVYARDPDGNLFSLIQMRDDSAYSIDRLKKKKVG